MVLTPGASDMQRLQRLHRSIARLAYDAPELILNTEVARGLEQSLIHAMIQCLPPPANGLVRLPAQRRSMIMQRFRDVLDNCGDTSIYVPELCARLGVPSRTLRTICHEYLGIGPKKYLLLRRMHLARRALRIGDAAKTTVTEIATQFGFWQLGQFSVDYKALFGESPSTTLLQ
jgi:AraC-like DNA-binding protein